ncbi:PQQ-binding-like beta-propeller repeat protein [Ktedonospora formicarum]|uniref:Pyrrolo-quinoline quinone repeat domain-containing protein n=1 Tax=Ktedonospora formicarum TaxID=2778364 RepID=A0A8J3I6U5_9CHLR|nr:PQQ-binding-like beta-propeller repeat protein [Ktedonospora formicarum]GHO50639.1 hypothetical protein KSX_88020 [Ktedonospora formicarum]
MSEYTQPSKRRLVAIYRYISALELSDIETLSIILKEASQDAVLSGLLEEVDTVYQTIDRTAVSELEARRAYHCVLKLDQNSHLEQNQPALLQYMHDDKKRTLVNVQGLSPLPQRHNHQPSTRSRWRHGLQRGAMLLVACFLLTIGVRFFMIYEQAMHSSTTTPPNAQALHGIVVAMTGEGTSSSSARVYGIRPDTGEQVWYFSLPKGKPGQNMSQNLIVQGQTIYALFNSQVYALRATDGKLLWHTDLFHASSPQESYKLVSDGNMLYVGSGPGGNMPFVDQLVALRPKDGSIAWQHTYKGSGATFLGASNGIVYLATNIANESQLHALRGSDGTQMWAYPGGEVISVIADETNVYLFAMAHTIQQDPSGMHKDEKVILALNVQNGHQRWTTQVKSNGIYQLQMDRGRLFLNEHNGNSEQICSWQVEDGHQVWCHSYTGDPQLFGTPYYLVANGALYFFSPQSTIVGTATEVVKGKTASTPKVHQKTIIQVYDASDGQAKKWGTTLDDWSTGNATVDNKQLFVATANHIWAFDQRGSALWSYQRPSQSANSSDDIFFNGFCNVDKSSW